MRKTTSHPSLLSSGMSKPKLSKGQRKGWVNVSDYKSVPVNTIKWQGQKVVAYEGNRFGLPKLVP